MGIFVCLNLFGCATVRSIEKHYSRIDYSDGINEKEAKLIAKKSIIDSHYRGLYRIIRPSILDNPDTFPHQQHWFLKLKGKSSKAGKSDYLVVIDKRSGEVIYAKKNYPSNVQGYQWIIDMRKFSNSP